MLALHGQHASFCCLMDATTLRLRLRTKLKTFSQVFVRSEPDNEEKRTEMTHLEGNSNRYDTWQADIQLNQDVQVTRYVFKLLRDSQPQLWLDTQGLQPRISGREHHFRYCTETPPSWVQQQVEQRSLHTHYVLEAFEAFTLASFNSCTCYPTLAHAAASPMLVPQRPV
eukprot:m.121338 g.121338  ORF g.121338 m.121338 type:complete len:169 (-) comp15634_c0_seq2:91-597(-)